MSELSINMDISKRIVNKEKKMIDKKSKVLPRLFVTLILLCVIGKIAKAQNIQPWASDSPLSIPLKVRKAYYKKGNLVPNPSFEQAKILKNDSTITHFKLAYWHVIGNDVQLVDTKKQSNYGSDEVYQGHKAIKIKRSINSVKEIHNKPEGVESDFIKVIPGNYNFYFYIRLKNIWPSIRPYVRMRHRVGEGIDIRIKYYDKNKKEIPPGRYSATAQYFDYGPKLIDNGFKGFAFSNYFYIRNFPWGRVRGKTWVYPYVDSDLPDDCRYIKIFLGLATNGTMWIDNIDFQLSEWNFTYLERMRPFFKKKYDLTDLMIPTPQSINNKHNISLKNQHIRLVYSGKKAPEIKKALTLLQNRFSKINGESVKVIKNGKPVSSHSGLQIVFVEKDNRLAAKFDQAFEAINDKAQGYFIRRKGNTIYLGGNQPVGFYYAATSLCQLIDYEHYRLDYADVTDWPDFTGRSLKIVSFSKKQNSDELRATIKQFKKDVKYYASYKLNDIYNSYGMFGNHWWKIGKISQQYTSIKNYLSSYGHIMALAVQLNPYRHLPSMPKETTLSDSLRSLFSNGTQEGFEKIINALKPALDAGAKIVMFCMDDHTPRKLGPQGEMRGDHVLFTKSDKKKFVNLANAHYYLLNKLKTWLDKNYGDVRLEFVPPIYCNWHINQSLGTARSYYRDLTRHLDPSIVLVWTGPTGRSLYYDMAAIHRIMKYYRRKPMVWDNGIYGRKVRAERFPRFYPEKSVLYSLFQPFDEKYSKKALKQLNSHFYTNLPGIGEINKITYLTFADFTWNTKDYDPAFSLFKALVQNFGKKNAKRLLQFNDKLFRFISTWAQLKQTLKRGHVVSKVRRELLKKEAQRQIKAMKQAFQALSPLKDQLLKKELRDKMDSKIKNWQKLYQKS